MQIRLTSEGKGLLLRSLAGETTITFTQLQLGNSTEWGDAEEVQATQLKNPIITIPFSDCEKKDDYIFLTSVFSNTEMDSGFRITERGFFAKDSEEKEILYAVGIEKEETADYIPSKSEKVFEVELESMIYIGDSENVTAVLNESLTSVSRAEFKSHVEDFQNPHKVTKALIGLGKVPNVATDDQLPNFTESEELENIISGVDKLSVLFGKTKKAISELIKHLKDKDNPHKITPESIKAANESHEHSATDIKKGILVVNRGGSGKNTFKENAVLLGNKAEAFKEVKGEGAFHSDGVNPPEFGTLPINFGGTGLTKGAEFSYKDDYGCYGAIVLPGGLLVQWGRLKCEDRTATVKLLKKYANKRYSVIFTTSAGSVDSVILTPLLPDWRVPEKSVDSFKMARDGSAGTQVADWVAFGQTLETN